MSTKFDKIGDKLRRRACGPRETTSRLVAFTSAARWNAAMTRALAAVLLLLFAALAPAAHAEIVGRASVVDGDTIKVHGQNSTGGKERLGHISKAGNRYLRMLLVVGALSVIKRAKQLGYTRWPWLAKLMERRSTKIARTAWAMMAHGTFYEEPAVQAA